METEKSYVPKEEQIPTDESTIATEAPEADLAQQGVEAPVEEKLESVGEISAEDQEKINMIENAKERVLTILDNLKSEVLNRPSKEQLEREEMRAEGPRHGAGTYVRGEMARPETTEVQQGEISPKFRTGTRRY